jgi:integrase
LASAVLYRLDREKTLELFVADRLFVEKASTEDLTWDSTGSCSVKICGKGRKIRFRPLWKKTMAELQPLIRGRDVASPLFLNRYGEPITRFGIHALVARHTKAAAQPEHREFSNASGDP